MKRFFAVSAATGLALSVLATPLAMAQSDQHVQPGGQAPAHSGDTHSMAPASHAAPQHMATQHASPQHMNMQHAPMQASNHGAIQTRAPEQHVTSQQRPPMQQDQHAQMGNQLGNMHQWHNGDRYDGNREVVSNWNQYHLRQPPEGYEWVQDGSQFVLIAVATGIIADIFLNAANR